MQEAIHGLVYVLCLIFYGVVIITDFASAAVDALLDFFGNLLVKVGHFLNEHKWKLTGIVIGAGVGASGGIALAMALGLCPLFVPALIGGVFIGGIGLAIGHKMDE